MELGGGLFALGLLGTLFVVAETFEFAQCDCVQVLMLYKDLAFLLSHNIGELVFVGAFFIWVADLRLLAGLFEKISASHFVSSESHAE